MRLEKFKDTLLPIDYILYAKLDKEEKAPYDGKYRKITRVYFIQRGTHGFVSSVEFDGNCLDEFQKWFNSFKEKDEVTSTWSWSNLVPEIVPCQKKRSEELDHIFTEAIWQTPGKTIQHDGIEHLA